MARRLMQAFFAAVLIIAGGSFSWATGFEALVGTPPKLRLEFYVEPPGWPYAVDEYLREFARAEGLEYQGDHDQMPIMDGRRIFAATLSGGDVVLIAVLGNLPDEEGRFLVLLYEPTPNPEFAGIAARMTDGLKERWPDTALYLAP